MDPKQEVNLAYYAYKAQKRKTDQQNEKPSYTPI